MKSKSWFKRLLVAILASTLAFAAAANLPRGTQFRLHDENGALVGAGKVDDDELEFDVKRDQAGFATLTVTRPDGSVDTFEVFYGANGRIMVVVDGNVLSLGEFARSAGLELDVDVDDDNFRGDRWDDDWDDDRDDDWDDDCDDWDDDWDDDDWDDDDWDDCELDERGDRDSRHRHDRDRDDRNRDDRNRDDRDRGDRTDRDSRPGYCGDDDDWDEDDDDDCDDDDRDDDRDDDDDWDDDDDDDDWDD